MEKDYKEPLISICIPAYNAEKYINQTMDCLLNQTYRNLELIVVDDGSTDKTLSILKSYSDTRLAVLQNPRKNAASARNHSFLNSAGKYIVFFDADDWIPNDFIECQLKCIKSENDIVAANWGRFYRDDLSSFKSDPNVMQVNLTYEEWILAYWNTAAHITPPGRLFFSRKLVEQTPLWDESLTLNDDFQFFNELFFHCDRIIYSNSDFYYRSGIEGLSSKKSEFFHLSNYYSLKRGIELALLKYPNSENIKICCANMWQNLKYQIYPSYTKLIDRVDEELAKLPSPNFKFPAGGITKILNLLFGWKLTTTLKHWLKV